MAKFCTKVSPALKILLFSPCACTAMSEISFIRRAILSKVGELASQA